MNGNLELTGVTIPNELLSSDKKEKLETAILAAHAEVLKKVQRLMATKMQAMGGLPKIPGLN